MNTFTQTKLILVSALSFFLVACGTSNTEQLPDTGGNNATNANYTGPSPDTDDVQQFKLAMWDNLVSTERCGSCHSTGGQSPVFVHDEDINIAYAQANTVVDLGDPSESAIVTKVAGGHNCWLASDSACADTITSYIENWAGESAGSVNEIVLRAPVIRDPGSAKQFPNDSSNFGPIHTVLTTYCSNCHVEGQQTPFIGSSFIDTSYEEAKSKINLETPAASRLVGRLRDEFHNCWDGDCAASAATMEAVITDYANLIDAVDIDPALVASKALRLTEDGIAANTGGRYEEHVIALYEFKSGDPTRNIDEGNNNIAYDTSGIEPQLNLTLSGNVEWVGGWGIKVGPAISTDSESYNNSNGKAQGSTSDSSKLHDLIRASGEFSVEAWLVPGNVTQEDSRIITYSGSEMSRNFALGQTLYNYDFLMRSTETDQNVAFSTADADERLQATLQHVVINFTPGGAREIYVNGVHTGDVDPDDAGLLNEWDDSFAFVLGNETDRNSLWQGTLRMVAIHNRALTQEQITQNYSSGVGEKFFLLFSVEHLIDVEESFVVFEVSQFDSYSYLFTEPFFISLDEEESPDGIALSGIKLGINGKEVELGQAYKNVDIELNSDDYTAGVGQTISELGTIIPIELGAANDEFFLSFEQLGTHTNVVVEADPPAASSPAIGEAKSDIGLKTFDEINASMSEMTGIAKTESGVANTYNTIRQQLPVVENIEGFLSAHQMAITQLAIQYCNALVEDTSERASFFTGFDFDASADTAFDAAGRDQIIDPLLENVVGTNLGTQPSDVDIEDELNDLIDTLTSCGGGCASDRTETVVKATCAAALGSAVMLIQ